MARQAVRLNACSEIALTKLDVLDQLKTIKVCVAYEVDGRRYEYLPHLRRLHDRATPIYEELPGWQEDITAVRRYEDLPQATRSYVEWVEERVGAPILMLSVGPERDQVIPRGL